MVRYPMLGKWWPFKRDPLLEEWRRHLTPELRTHFKRVGEQSVQHDISNHNYKSPEKQCAALAWLHGKRARRTFFRWIIIIAAIVSIGAFLWNLQDRKAERQRQAWSVIAQAAITQANIGLNDAMETLNNDGVSLKRLRLPRAWLEGVQLPGADLRWSILQLAQLNGADLSGANLGEVFLQGADLQAADLRKANLTGTNLTGAHFRKANLSGADISGADFTQANNLTQGQISSACADAVRPPILPVGIEPPPPCAKETRPSRVPSLPPQPQPS